VCSFDCIYCECGRNPEKYEKKAILPSRKEVSEKLKLKLEVMAEKKEFPDVITFAGNGEPTLHPEFAGIIHDTIQIRNVMAPGARIAVLSNATMIHKKSVFGALLLVDDNIQKIDSAFEETIRVLDCPAKNFSLSKTVKQLRLFKGRVIIQTMFVRGTLDEKVIDNTTDAEISAWIDLLRQINPCQVMIYTIARDTPVNTLKKIPENELRKIAEKVTESGFYVQVSA